MTKGKSGAVSRLSRQRHCAGRRSATAEAPAPPPRVTVRPKASSKDAEIRDSSRSSEPASARCSRSAAFVLYWFARVAAMVAVSDARRPRRLGRSMR